MEVIGFQRCIVFFVNDTATTEIYTLSLHDALPIWLQRPMWGDRGMLHTHTHTRCGTTTRSEEHTSELQSHLNIVCRLLLEKKNSGMIGAYLRARGRGSGARYCSRLRVTAPCCARCREMRAVCRCFVPATCYYFFFSAAAPTETYCLSLPDALPI